MTSARAPIVVPNRRDRILDVAEPLFASGGYAGVGMRQIAATAGLSKSSLFHHFPTKLDLYGDVLDRVLERLERALGDESPRDAGPVEELERWIASILGAVAEDAPAARLMMRALVDEEPFPGFALEPSGRARMPFENRLARIIERLRSLLEEGIGTGAFRTVAIGDAIQSVIGAVVFHGVSDDLGDARVGEPSDSSAAVERRCRAVSEFACRGLMA